MTEQLQLAWCAGFFDGEGTVGIARQDRRRGRARVGEVFHTYTLNVAICQKDPVPLQIFHDLFGGHFYPYAVKGVTYWRWHTWSNLAVRFMEAILPYLVLKRERVEIGIDFQKKLNVWYEEYGKRGYPPEVDAARAEFFERLRVLNKRNRAEGSPVHRRPGVKKGSPNYLANRWANQGKGAEPKVVETTE